MRVSLCGPASDRDSRFAISRSGKTTWQHGTAMPNAKTSYGAFTVQGLVRSMNSSTFRSTATRTDSIRSANALMRGRPDLGRAVSSPISW